MDHCARVFLNTICFFCCLKKIFVCSVNMVNCYFEQLENSHKWPMGFVYIIHYTITLQDTFFLSLYFKDIMSFTVQTVLFY